MKIISKNLIGLPVKTEQGQLLGKVKAFVIDTDSQSVLEYEIKPSNIAKELLEGDLLISRGQVVDISAKALTVKDNFSKKENLIKLQKKLQEKKSVVFNKNNN